MNEQDAQSEFGSKTTDEASHIQHPMTRATSDTDVQSYQMPGWGLWVKWALASGIVGLAPFGAWFLSWLSSPLLANLQSNTSLFQLAVFIVSVLAAFASALAQWAALRPHIRN